jgi:hypothetical protein
VLPVAVTRALAAGDWTYKEFLGSRAKGGLFRRVLQVGRHVDEVGLFSLLVELGLECRQKRVARHWSAARARAILTGG